MGAWGEKTFEDDTSLDLIDEWMSSDNAIDLIAQAIASALEADELDYTQGQEVAVAAAILDYVLTDNSPEIEDADIEGLSVWLETLPAGRLRSLRDETVRAIELLLGEKSELRELWEENEELYTSWVGVHEARKDRLLALE